MLLTMSQRLSLLQLSFKLLQLLQSGILTEKKARSNCCLHSMISSFTQGRHAIRGLKLLEFKALSY
jgi:hypothetical protein